LRPGGAQIHHSLLRIVLEPTLPQTGVVRDLRPHHIGCDARAFLARRVLQEAVCRGLPADLLSLWEPHRHVRQRRVDGCHSHPVRRAERVHAPPTMDPRRHLDRHGSDPGALQHYSTRLFVSTRLTAGPRTAQVRILNLAMINFGASEVVPVYYVLFTMASIGSGMVREPSPARLASTRRMPLPTERRTPRGPRLKARAAGRCCTRSTTRTARRARSTATTRSTSCSGARSPSPACSSSPCRQSRSSAPTSSTLRCAPASPSPAPLGSPRRA